MEMHENGLKKKNKAPPNAYVDNRRRLIQYKKQEIVKSPIPDSILYESPTNRFPSRALDPTRRRYLRETLSMYLQLRLHPNYPTCDPIR